MSELVKADLRYSAHREAVRALACLVAPRQMLAYVDASNVACECLELCGRASDGAAVGLALAALRRQAVCGCGPGGVIPWCR